MKTHVTYREIVERARDLRADDDDLHDVNPEYDRALVELIFDCGFGVTRTTIQNDLFGRVRWDYDD